MSDQPRCGDCRWWTETAPDLADGMCHHDPAGARTLRTWWCSHVTRRPEAPATRPVAAPHPAAVSLMDALAGAVDAARADRAAAVTIVPADPTEAARRAVPPITPRNNAGRPKGKRR